MCPPRVVRRMMSNPAKSDSAERHHVDQGARLRCCTVNRNHAMRSASWPFSSRASCFFRGSNPCTVPQVEMLHMVGSPRWSCTPLDIGYNIANNEIDHRRCFTSILGVLHPRDRVASVNELHQRTRAVTVVLLRPRSDRVGAASTCGGVVVGRL